MPTRGDEEINVRTERVDLTVTVIQIADLTEWYPGLSNRLVPQQRGGGGGRSVPGSKLPVRLDTLDTIVAFRTESERWESKARRLLGLGKRPNADVQRSLIWIEAALNTIQEVDDQSLLEEIIEGVAGLHLAVRRIKDEVSRPIRLDIRCPFCDQRLQANLDQAEVYCTNNECRCVSDDCGCNNGRRRAHLWPESSWELLGLLISIH